ncbi:putative heat shock protein [Ixodes scapularis]
MPSSEILVPSWFDGVEHVFVTYEVPERLRGSLVRPYFTERMRALVNRLPVGEASEYKAVKERVLLELRLSPAEYRRLFLKATRMERESWTQFATRVESCFGYYARSRGIESLEDLIALMVSDRIRDSLPTDMQAYATLNEVVRSQTTTVALSFGFYENDLPEDKVRVRAFVDMAHSVLHVALMAFIKDRLKMLATTFDGVGGRDSGMVLVRYFVQEFTERYKLDVATNRCALMRLITECEKLKNQMCANPHGLPLNVECSKNDRDVAGKVKREIFEAMSTELLARAEHTMAWAPTVAGLWPPDVKSVERVGGGTRVPAVKQLVRKLPFIKMLTFSRSKPFNLETRYPQEAVVPHPDLQLGSFTGNKVVSEAEGGASKIKVKVRLSLRGIFSVVSASAVDRKPDGR